MKVIRQKSFSIFQELYHSGTDRVKKKYLGRIRRGIAEKAQQFARDQVAVNRKLNRSLKDLPDIENKDLARKIVREGRKQGDARVFDKNEFAEKLGIPESNFNRKITQDELPDFKNQYETKLFRPKTKRVLKSIIDRKNIVNLTGDYDKQVSVLAHEIGHAMNNTGSAGKKKKLISRLDTIKKSSEPKGTIMDTIKRKAINYKEEKNAWDNAFDILKKNGASKEEMKIAKKQRKDALGTYRSSGLSDIGDEVVKKYIPEGLNKKIGIYPSSVSDSKKNMRQFLRGKYDGVATREEIDDLVNNLKTDRQLYRQQKLRRAKRKDKSMLGQIFGNW